MRWPVVAVLVGLMACGMETSFAPPTVGDQAPSFSAVAMDGTPVTLADYRGQPIMLNIWATWCGPCRKEMPELQVLHDTYADQGFKVVGVSVDNRAAGDAIRMFVGDLDLTFPILHDPEALVQESYFLLGLPGTFLIDKEGVIVRKWTGPLEPMADDVQESVRSIL